MAQEAAGEEHTGKSLGSYTPALAGLDKLSVTSILQGPGIATWDIGEYNTPSCRKKEKKKVIALLFISSSFIKQQRALTMCLE